MTPSSCIAMAAYNRWMNARLYDAAATLTEAQLFEDRGAFFGSLFDTLNHLVVADLIWLRRFALHDGSSPMASSMAPWPSPTALDQRVASSLADLRALRMSLDDVITTLAQQITDRDLACTLHYRNTEGQEQAKNLGMLLLHFFNHQTHHRGQATTLLFQAGVDVGVTDLNAMIPNETRPRPGDRT